MLPDSPHFPFMLLNTKLRSAKPEDEKFVNDLTKLVMHDYVCKTWDSEDDHKKYFDTNKFNLENTRIIEQDGKNIGRLTLINQEGSIHLDNIHFIPEYQSCGIGKKIIEDVINNSKEKHLYVTLQVLRTNPAKALYERLGFKVYDENNTHYFMRTYL